MSAVDDAIERAENDWYHPMARDDRTVLAKEVKRLRAQVAAVEDVLRDLDYPNPEADQDWQEDPVSCIRDALRAALAFGETEQQRRWRQNREDTERRYRTALASGGEVPS